MASSAEVAVRLFVHSALQQALASSIAGGTFADTAYHLYSQRRSTHKIGKPRVVYGSSVVLKSVSNFLRTQLDEASSKKDLPSETEEYDYESDSDLDESEDAPDMASFEEELLDSTEPSRGLSPTLSELDILDIQSVETEEPASEPKPLVPEKTATLAQGKYNIAIHNVAANTWQALIHFAYTGKIYFSPLKSEGLEARQEAKQKHLKTNPHLPPLCSPKSVYRLAKMVGLATLEELAYNDIKARMSAQTVMSEVFSIFSSRHDDVLDMQLEILYRDGMLAGSMSELSKTIASICRGEKPYCDRVLTALMRTLSTLLTTTKPAQQPSPNAAPPPPPGVFDSSTARDPHPPVTPPLESPPAYAAPEVPPSGVLFAQQGDALMSEDGARDTSAVNAACDTLLSPVLRVRSKKLRKGNKGSGSLLQEQGRCDEEEQLRLREEEQKRRNEQEKKRHDEEEQKRREEEERKRCEEEERKRCEEEEKERQRLAEEVKRRSEEEQQKRRDEEEQKRREEKLRCEEEERKRLKVEKLERLRKQQAREWEEIKKRLEVGTRLTEEKLRQQNVARVQQQVAPLLQSLHQVWSSG